MILDKIAAKTKIRVQEQKEKVSLEEIKAEALSMDANTGYPFYQALAKKELSYICEVKKASPSKGIIAEHFPYLEIAKEYEKAGASAISCLTEPYWFLGSDAYLKEIAANVSIPVLRKDFVVDKYMIYEAKVLGASAVLLICAILEDDVLEEYIKIAKSLGLTPLVEAHDAAEIKSAIKAGAEVIGVNNRDLRDFSVDVNNSTRYRAMIPDNILFVSESGIKTNDDINVLKGNGTNAVLIGETLMRAPDKKKMLEDLNGGPVL
ncbi:MAG: indole-3-glycerol phosphate synthase TrpC [Lachnospiraceae bacterium]|nr:indole-3-glycerol phosphate synthase TrpC [Lachnospiraceae bacterium]